MSVGLDVFDSAYFKAMSWPLPIVAYRERSPCLISMAATYDLPPHDKSVPAVRDCVNFRRQQFLTRAYELSKHDQYFLVRGIIPNPHYFDVDRAVSAFKLCAYCKPTTVIYPPAMQRKKHKFKSCGHTNFCPACWCAVAMRQHQQYREVLNAFLRQNQTARVYTTFYTTEQFISLPDIAGLAFADKAARTKATLTVQKELLRYKRFISAQRKQLQRTTVGSYWRLVGWPVDGGLVLQFRQVFLTLPGQKPPISATNIKGSRIVKKKTVLSVGGQKWQERFLDDAENELGQEMIEFLRFPKELLTEDSDVAASYLNAAAKQRMVGGYGKFRSAGSGLVKKMRKRDKEQQARRDKQKSA